MTTPARRTLLSLALWATLALGGLSACASWKLSAADRLRQDLPEGGRVLLVTDTLAVDLQVDQLKDTTISGRALRSWSVASGAVTLGDADASPESVAARNSWQRRPEAPGAPVTLAFTDLRHVSVFDPSRGGMVGLAVGAPVAVASVTGLLLFIFSTLFVACGRPLRVRGKRVLTPLQKGSAWGAPLTLQPVPAQVRQTLIDIWTQEAQAEHAAVAAFSKLSLELLALGAPPDLITRANRAAIQEVEHARLCFALAGAYRGEAITAAPLPQALEGDTVCLRRLARESLLDGCIREGIAAVIARLGAETAADPEVARVMRVQAREEAQHAALGWSIVEWCLEVGGEEIRALLLRTLGEAELPRTDDLPEHGRVGEAVIAPHFAELCARAQARLEAAGQALAA